MLKNLNILSYFGGKSINDITMDEKKENSNDASEENISIYKEWGNYLLQFGKSAKDIAAKQAVEMSLRLKENIVDPNKIVDEVNILDKFSEEQSKFKAEIRTKEENIEKITKHWLKSLENSKELMNKILDVSEDERNFLRNPPAGSDFKFDLEAHTKVMMYLLDKDEKLRNMRFNIVPKKIKEEIFWNNYFYRLTLIKQAVEGTSNNSEVTETEESIKERYNIRETNTSESYEDTVEFVSDSAENSGISVKEKDKKSKEHIEVSNEELEAELQKELCEFELVSEINGKDNLGVAEDKAEYDDLEQEILDEIEKKD